MELDLTVAAISEGRVLYPSEPDNTVIAKLKTNKLLTSADVKALEEIL